MAKRIRVALAGVLLVCGAALIAPITRVAGRASSPGPRPRPLATDVRLDPLATYRVRERRTPQIASYDGIDYRSDVSAEGLAFRADDFLFHVGATELEQGGVAVPLAPERLDSGAFARSRILRGALVEEYLFENGRVEQVFRIDAPVGEGALRVRMSVATDLTGPVEVLPRRSGGWTALSPWRGGLCFCDAAGERRLAYHGAVAIDAAGQRVELDPLFASGEITLEVPAGFMEAASFPVIIDPWIELAGSAAAGGVSNSTTVASATPSVALDERGRPTVAWSETAGGSTEIYLRRWNGAQWVELGGSASGGGVSATSSLSSTYPQVELDSQGNPVVAWREAVPSSVVSIYLRRWNGTSWVEVGGSATGTGVSSGLGAVALARLKLDAAGHPIVAWSALLTRAIHLRRWNGSAWTGLGGSDSASGLGTNASSLPVPALAIDPAGNPIVAWIQRLTTTTTAVYLKAWSGTSWVGLGGSDGGTGVSGAGAGFPGLAMTLGDSRPILAWTRSPATGIYCLKWDGTSWIGLGGDASTPVSGPSPNSVTPLLAADPGGAPILAWSLGGDIFLARWSGSAWEPLAGSMAAGGMSNTPTSSAAPALAARAGHPTVAWVEAVSGGSTDVYLRQLFEKGPLAPKQYIEGIDAGPGWPTNRDFVTFRALLECDDASLRASLQVEVQPFGTAFDGTVSAEGSPVLSGQIGEATVGQLAPGPYHWRARLVDSQGVASEWVPFGPDAETEPDFIVDPAYVHVSGRQPPTHLENLCSMGAPGAAGSVAWALALLLLVAGVARAR